MKFANPSCAGLGTSRYTTSSLISQNCAEPTASDLCPYLLPESIPLERCPQAVMSGSLGRAGRIHSIDAKIQALCAFKYTAIEIHFDCLITEAQTLFGLILGAEPSREQLYAAANSVKRKCDAAGLTILCIEPFLHYPGLLPVARRDQRLKQDVPVWFTISDILGTDMIQIASAIYGGDDVTTDGDRVVQDLQLLADMGMRWPRQKYWAYEAMCFGCGTTTWKQALREVELVGMPNFGMVLDTFQILGSVFADPCARDGKLPGADQAVEATLTEIRAAFQGPQNKIRRDKVFFVQLGDAARPDPPLSPWHELWDPSSHANLKMTWARNFRRFVGEGYMPSDQIARVFLVECGWRGCISAEVICRGAFSTDPGFPAEAARRCRAGHDIVLASMLSS